MLPGLVVLLAQGAARADGADEVMRRELFGAHAQVIIFSFDRAGLISGIDPEND